MSSPTPKSAMVRLRLSELASWSTRFWKWSGTAWDEIIAEYDHTITRAAIAEAIRLARRSFSEEREELNENRPHYDPGE
jgi:hypothetical protein